MADDPSRVADIAAEYPEVVRELIARWWEEAEKYKVLPLDGSAQARLATVRPQTSKPRDRFVYYPGGSVVPAFAAPPVYNRAVLDRGRRRHPRGRRRGRARGPGRRRRRLRVLHEGRQLCFLYNYVGLDRFEVLAADGGLERGPARAALRVRADRRAGHRERQGRPGPRPALRRRQARRRERVPAHDAAVLRARRAELRLRLRRPGRRVRPRRSRSPARSARSPSTSPAS